MKRLRNIVALACLCTLAHARPQTPAEPLGYPTHEMVVEVRGGGDAQPSHTLAGTLTLPPASFGEGPHPCVVMLTGSGPQDRDQTIMGHKMFAVLADALAHAGVASLRCDDRGIGKSTGTFLGATTRDFATDAAAAVGAARDHAAIDADRVGVLGHSEGGVVAALTAAADERVAFAVLSASPAVPGRDLMVLQARLLAGQAGVSDDLLDEQAAAQGRFFDALVGGEDREVVIERMLDLIEVQVRMNGGTPDRGALTPLAERAMAAQGGPWMRTFLALDPAESIARIRCPVLALNGLLDLQVDPDQNLPVIERALRDAGNREVTVVRLGGLNHLLQPTETGAASEYGLIETTIDETALAIIVAWIGEVARADEGDSAVPPEHPARGERPRASDGGLRLES